jgi:CheY-like chemotaxis protein
MLNIARDPLPRSAVGWWFLVADPPPGANERAEEESSAAGHGVDGGRAPLTILVVDDDDDIRESLASILEEEGYAVHTAANGRLALDVLEEIPRPALAIVDLRMPVMDGVELIHEMRGDARLAAVPILVLSAASIVAAPDGIPRLSKPSSVETILAAIRTHAAN